MVRNKFAKKIAACLLSIGVLSGVIYTNVQAANTSDTYWQFYKEFGNAGARHTDGRVKYNDTPAYVKISYYEGGRGDYIQMTVTDTSKEHVSLRGDQKVVTAYGTGQYSVHNRAYEKRRQTPVCIEMWAPYRQWTSWSASGVWSPDSTRSYD